MGQGATYFRQLSLCSFLLSHSAVVPVEYRGIQRLALLLVPVVDDVPQALELYIAALVRELGALDIQGGRTIVLADAGSDEGAEVLSGVVGAAVLARHVADLPLLPQLGHDVLRHDLLGVEDVLGDVVGLEDGDSVSQHVLVDDNRSTFYLFVQGAAVVARSGCLGQGGVIVLEDCLPVLQFVDSQKTESSARALPEALDGLVVVVCLVQVIVLQWRALAATRVGRLLAHGELRIGDSLLSDEFKTP